MKIYIPILVAMMLLGGSGLIHARTVAVGDSMRYIPYYQDGIDSILFKVLPEVIVIPKPKFRNDREILEYYKLVRDVKATLPFARAAAWELNRVNDTLQYISSERKRKAFLKDTEKELFNKFEKPLRRLTFSQGRLLMKLIDRECKNTSYELVKTYRGTFSAFFWQTMARMFGANLKSEYSPESVDRFIEQIILLIDNGQL